MNPATRLYQALKSIKNIRIEQTKTIDQFSVALGIETNEGKEKLREVLSSINELLNQSKEAQDQLKAMGGNQKLLLKPFPNIDDFLLAVLGMLNIKWNQVKPDFEKIDLSALEHIADRLDEFVKEPLIEYGELESILNDISSLYSQISQSNFPDKFKAFFLDRLEELRRSIHEYHISGTLGLQEKIAAIYAKVEIRRVMIEEEPITEEAKGIWNRFATIMNRAKDVVELHVKALPLIDKAIDGLRFLGLLGPGNPD